jgi:cytochrome c2
VHLGEQQLVFFRAENLSEMAIVGHATFNVTPATTGIYFNKIQCFCFDEERLDAHQKVDMPVLFFVSPEMMTDSETRDVDTITLSYTFFRSANPENAKDLSRFLSASGEPNPVRGRQAFAERCAACHALEINKTGPRLGNVFGRPAASAPGYRYSPALTHAGLTWSADNLDRWLTNPGKMIPGTRMPVRVLDGMTRKDLIAYLKEQANRPARRTYSEAGTSSAGQPTQN